VRPEKVSSGIDRQLKLLALRLASRELSVGAERSLTMPGMQFCSGMRQKRMNLVEDEQSE